MEVLPYNTAMSGNSAPATRINSGTPEEVSPSLQRFSKAQLITSVCILLVFLSFSRIVSQNVQRSTLLAPEYYDVVSRLPNARPQVLTNVMVMITYFWNVQHLAQFQQVLSTIQQYPTKVEIIVFTNKVDQLAAFRSSIMSESDFKIQPTTSDEPFMLAWEHRHFITNTIGEGENTAFLYIEDDIIIPWNALLAWAEDDAMLTPLNLQRSFYRVEVEAATGQLSMVDSDRISLKDYVPIIHLNETYCDPSQRICDFLQLPVSYTGIWVASREKVLQYSQSPNWTNVTFGPWKVRENAACGLQFFDVPTDIGMLEKLQFRQKPYHDVRGGSSAALVPYHESNATLLSNSAIYHSSNKYCAARKAESTRGPCTSLISTFLQG